MALLFRLVRAWEQHGEAKEALWVRFFTLAAKFATCIWEGFGNIMCLDVLWGLIKQQGHCHYDCVVCQL